MYEELMVLNHIVKEKDFSIFTRSGITEDYIYVHKEIYDYVKEFHDTYNEFPSVNLLIEKYDQFENLEVENINYMVKELAKHKQKRELKPVFETAIDLYKDLQMEKTIDYLWEEVQKIKAIQAEKQIFHDWAKDADVRLDRFKEVNEKPELATGVSTGFTDIDDVTGGIVNGDLLIILARLKNGKSWVGQRILTEAFNKGMNVALFSLEMNQFKTGYRLDTLKGKFSNKGLVKGNSEKVDTEVYENYIHELKQNDKFFHIITNADNKGKKWSVWDIKNYIIANKPDIVAIDQLSLVGWGKKFFSATDAYGFIAESLKTMALDLGIPIILLAQADRASMGKMKDDPNAMPEAENLQYSDKVMQYCDKGLAIRKDADIVKLKVIANRDGESGDIFTYRWYFDTGIVEGVDDKSLNM